AVPGRVDSEASAGTNALIRDQHAKLVTHVDDILDELGEAGEVLKRIGGEASEPAREAPPARLNLNEDEQAVYAALGKVEQSLEGIAEASGRPAAKVASTLITLQ